ncbi:DUF3226 domain-containing protein [Longimicrobium terrae]|uniref:ATP-dependent endonuclease n=1 Tax=Longimicrobium terrae TaxID=1639882 RepID=A0A841GTC8_9BACT|nr:DUF3226 domain-containing protein [Longimicrobium terrae]MBB4635405.1 hypothetical protein [Longimicrobium terrae]MBB6069799.1 hypothetical protein [Longimicrobium terrae]NNC30992.1 hypothetical protein [Longimicrobium terrae]
MNAPIAPARLLWVEGKDDAALVNSLCLSHKLPRSAFLVRENGGVDALLSGLPVALNAPDLLCFGIVVDANGDPAARWAVIRSVLLHSGYADVPVSIASGGLILARAADLPRFGLWIMPDNGSAGMLEDFAAAMIPSSDVLLPHALHVVDGLPERRFSPAHRAKAVMHTWLAWQAGPGSPMGQAIGKGALDANAPAAREFVDWVRRLMLDDEGDGR